MKIYTNELGHITNMAATPTYGKNPTQEVSLKKIIVEGYRAVGSLNDSFQSSNFLLAPLLLLFLIDFGQW